MSHHDEFYRQSAFYYSGFGVGGWLKKYLCWNSHSQEEQEATADKTGKEVPHIEGGLENSVWTSGIGNVRDNLTQTPHFSLRKLKPREVK